MEAYRHGRSHLAHPPEKISHLTKLYTDAKRSATTNININPYAAAHQETPEHFWALQHLLEPLLGCDVIALSVSAASDDQEYLCYTRACTKELFQNKLAYIAWKQKRS